VGVDRGGLEAGGVAQVAQRDGDQLVVVRLQRGLLAVPAERGAQVDQPVGGAGLADPAPLGEGEGGGLDRPPLHRRHQEARGVCLGQGPGVGDAQGERHHGDRRGLDARQLGARGGGQVGEQPGGGGGRYGQHHGVGGDRALVGRGADGERERSAGRGAAQPADRGPGADLEPLGQGQWEPTHAAGETGEDGGRVGRRGGEARGLVEQRALLGEGDQLRDGRPGRDPSGVTGVHTAEEGLDEAVGDRGAEAVVDEVADRDVGADGGGGVAGLLADPGQLGVGEHAAGREVVEVQRHAHEGARQRAQRVAGPDPARGDGGVAHLEAEVRGQRDALGPAVEHRLGADVDGHARDAAAAQHAADLRGALEDEDVAALLLEPVRRRQAADPGADDHDLPVLTLLAHVPQRPTGNHHPRRRVPPA
jgi:hypothetical protein